MTCRLNTHLPPGIAALFTASILWLNFIPYRTVLKNLVLLNEILSRHQQPTASSVFGMFGPRHDL